MRLIRSAVPAGFIALAVLLGAPRAASACSCVGPNPVCSTYWSTSAVFVGRVLSISASSADLQVGQRSMPIPRRLVHMRVSEMFKGASLGELDVETGIGGGDCGYAFVVGEEYLVFADARAATLSTGICSNTMRSALAGPELGYLRGLASSRATRARIYGTFTEEPLVFSADGQRSTRPPFAGGRVTATGPAGKYTATSNRDGRYEILALPGRYEVTIDVPDGKWAPGSLDFVELTDSRGCAQVDGYVRPDGHVGGRVVNDRREPVEGLVVDVFPTKSLSAQYGFPAETAVTRADGTFDVVHLPPGDYQVGFNTTRRGKASSYPTVWLTSGAEPVTPRAVALTAGARVAVGDFVLPRDIEIVQLSGVVVDQRGLPLAGAHVSVETVTPSAVASFSRIVTSARGEFTVAVVAGYPYRAVANYVDRAGSDPFRYLSAAPVTVTAPAGPQKPITLVIKK